MNLIGKFGFADFLRLGIVAALSYVPHFKDAKGLVLGLFKLVYGLDRTTRILANLAIGGFAAFTGFVLSRPYAEAR